MHDAQGNLTRLVTKQPKFLRASQPFGSLVPSLFLATALLTLFEKTIAPQGWFIALPWIGEEI